MTSMKRGGKRKRLTKEHVEHVKSLYQRGRTYREIKRDTGLSGTSIAKILGGEYDYKLTQ